MNIKMCKSSSFIFFCLIFVVIEVSQAASILFLHQYASHSHIVVAWPLATALADRGHNVSFIASIPFPNSHPNISYFVPSRLNEKYEAVVSNDFSLSNRMENGASGGTSGPLFMISPRSGPILCEAMISSPDFQEWIQTDPHVDLIISESNMDCTLGIAWRLKSKIIVYKVLPMFFEFMESLGGPIEMVSSLYLPNKNPLSFWQRLETVGISLASRFANYQAHNQIDKILQRYLGHDGNSSSSESSQPIPPISELIKTVSLVFYNAHPIEEHKRSFPPNFISLPGIHVKDTHEQLAPEILDFLDSQKFIYISLGTLVDLNHLPQAIRNVFFTAIRAFPQVKFLWKWDVPVPADVPKNVYFAKYFAQQDVLAHKDILGFVTQAGRPSTQEALFNAVPMITFPVIGDQNYNSLMLEELGVSTPLEISDVTVPELILAFTKLIQGDFKKRSLEVAEILNDTPMKSLDTAVWWVEHVLRQNSLGHLQSLVINQSWLQKRLIDVWAFCAVILAGIILVLFAGISYIVNYIKNSSGIISKSSNKVKSSRKLKNK